MKTADQVFEEQFGESHYYSEHGKNQIIRAMKEYASQAIDRCADVARTRTNDESTSVIVDKKTILKVKSELK